MVAHSKYPRTAHLPFSLGATSDDIHGKNFAFLQPGVTAVVTEKMDGENTTLYRDGFHARSIDSQFHPSRSYMAQFHATIAPAIPSHRRLLVENLFAEHSIRYDNLPDYHYGIGVVETYDETGNPDDDGTPWFLSWDDTCKVLGFHNIIPAPILYVGEVDLDMLGDMFMGLDHEKHEGIVVRTFDTFQESDFSHHVGKAVRANHVQSENSWKVNWNKNGVRR